MESLDLLALSQRGLIPTKGHPYTLALTDQSADGMLELVPTTANLLHFGCSSVQWLIVGRPDPHRFENLLDTVTRAMKKLQRPQVDTFSVDSFGVPDQGDCVTFRLTITEKTVRVKAKELMRQDEFFFDSRRLVVTEHKGNRVHATYLLNDDVDKDGEEPERGTSAVIEGTALVDKIIPAE